MHAVTLNREQGSGRSRHRRWRWVALIAAVVAYPMWLMSYAYFFSLTSGLPGPRHGPQDAYRHALASAVLAFTISPRAVEWATSVMEAAEDPSSRMDRHNNAIGAQIGAETASFGQLRPQILSRVAAGRVNAADPRQVTWLPPNQWSALPF
jgi:hypothetical protein